MNNVFYIFSFSILSTNFCLRTPRPQLQGVVACHPIFLYIIWCWLITKDFTKMWWNYPTPYSCPQTMAIMQTHNLGRSHANQIDGTFLVPKKHDHSPSACSMPMFTLWNSPIPLHINNTHSHYPSKSMLKKCLNFKKPLNIP
jgi:hypothetical protein